MDGLGFSGVVAAVVAGIYLAATSRTSVVDEGSMESVYVNTFVFGFIDELTEKRGDICGNEVCTFDSYSLSFIYSLIHTYSLAIFSLSLSLSLSLSAPPPRWHFVEFTANTVLFILAGMMFGEILYQRHILLDQGVTVHYKQTVPTDTATSTAIAANATAANATAHRLLSATATATAPSAFNECISAIGRADAIVLKQAREAMKATRPYD